MAEETVDGVGVGGVGGQMDGDGTMFRTVERVFRDGCFIEARFRVWQWRRIYLKWSRERRQTLRGRGEMPSCDLQMMCSLKETAAAMWPRRDER
jgi:hypothetical protein